MKKFSILFFILFLICGVVLTSCSFEKEITNDEASSISTTNELTTAESEIIYEYDETINRFILKYNECFPNEKISSNMLTKYYHHGREHDDQVKFEAQGFNVLVTSTYVNGEKNGVEITLSDISNDNTKYKDAFKSFAKVLNSNLTNDELEKCWNDVILNESSTSIEEYKNLEFYIQKVNVESSELSMLQISGEI